MGRVPLTWLVIAAHGVGLPEIARADLAACDVSVVSAPEDVRDAIVAWVHGERTCQQLEVRAVATPDGYLVRARRADGRSFEQVVPDARTAGELVARWAADGAPPTPDIQLELQWTPPTRPTPQIDVDLQWTPPALPKPQIDLELQWTPPGAPKPQIDLELQWTPPGAPKPQIDLELQWTPPARPTPQIDVDLQWTPPASPQRATTEVERAIGLMPR